MPRMSFFSFWEFFILECFLFGNIWDFFIWNIWECFSFGIFGNVFYLELLIWECFSFVNADNEERPAYNVITTLNNNVEIREYLESKWACTAASSGKSQDSTIFFFLQISFEFKQK